MTKQLKEIEIPLGAKDSELCGWEYTIPEGMEATIVDNKIVVKKKESEDERIRKEIVRFIQMEVEDEIVGNKWIAWIEKQGEQKQDVNMQINPLEYINDMGGNGCYLKNTTQKPAWSEEDKETIDNLIDYLENELEISYMKEDKEGFRSQISLLKSLKERVQPQPKQEWSEEDEKLYNDLSDTYFYNDEDCPEETYKQMLKRVLDWMNKRAKSLRPQSHWKPSKEQIKQLEWIAKQNKDNMIGKELMTLYQDLKKLKG